MKLTWRHAALLGAVFAGCSSSPERIEYGNPEGYTVHLLSGASLQATEVTLNGLTLDTSSAEAIDLSVQSLLAATHAPRSVEELAPDGAGDLDVDFTASRPLPAHFYGANLQWHSKEFLTLPAYRALVRNIRIDRLRFPAGLERGYYDRDAIPSSADDLGNEEFRLTGQDVANYIALCREAGIAAEPQVNLAIDDAPMWQDMVDQIVNTLGYDLRFVAAGNEPDVPSARSPWSLYGATTLHEALASYGARYLRYRQALSAVKPGLTFVYGELGDWSGYFSDGLVPSVADAVDQLHGDQPGALSVHWYPMGELGQPADQLSYPSFAHVDGDVIRGELAGILAGMQSGAAKLQAPEFVLGEFATAWSVGQASKRVQDALGTALFDAEVTEYAKAIGFDSVAWWSLSDPASWDPWVTALIAVDGEQVSVRPQYYVHLMHKYLYGDRIVDVPGGQQARDWSVYASRDAAHRYLMLINRGDLRVQKVVRATSDEGARRLRVTLYPHALSIVSF